VQPTLEIISNHRDALGEGPWWDTAEQILYWVDSYASRIHAARLGEGTVASLTTPGEIGFAVKTASGGLLAGCRDGLYRNQTATEGAWQLLWPGDWNPSTLRVNDGKCDRQGRLWFGTLHDTESEAIAELYRLNGSEPLSMLDGITVSNGLGWSPDNLLMYYADSVTHSIMAFDFHPSTGDMCNPRIFATDPGPVQPDGLTVDADGCVWSAKWDGSKVIRYAPDGRIDRTISMPVSRPTSCMFVGSDLRTLAITSALPDVPDSEPLAGSLFLTDVGVEGLPETRADLSQIP
jgi:sugar lactone lactonase YvrE